MDFIVHSDISKPAILYARAIAYALHKKRRVRREIIVGSKNTLATSGCIRKKPHL